MFVPLSFLKSLFASKQSRFEELLESIYPIRIITKDESTDEILITPPISDALLSSLESLLQKGVEVRTEDIHSVQECLQEHIAEMTQSHECCKHLDGTICTYRTEQSQQSQSPHTEDESSVSDEVERDRWAKDRKERLERVLGLLQRFYKG